MPDRDYALQVVLHPQPNVSHKPKPKAAVFTGMVCALLFEGLFVAAVFVAKYWRWF
jgi:hypothetical protein